MEPTDVSTQPVPNHRARNIVLIVVAAVILGVIVTVCAGCSIILIQIWNTLNSGTELF